MSKANGFLQLRRGLWEHRRDGRMSITETLAFIYICSEADTRTGIWKGSAKSLSGEIGIPERTARDVLEKMEHADYIRRFATPGRHACYPILVHKFLITEGQHNGEHVNALDSRSPGDLAYFSRGQDVEQSVERGVQHGAAQRRKRIENKERETPSGDCGSLPIADGFEKFYSAYPRKKNRAAAEMAWRRKVKPEEAEAVLAKLEIFKLSEWKGKELRYIPYPASWLNGRRWEDEIEKGGTNAARSNGKPTGTELAVRNARALGLADKPVN